MKKKIRAGSFAVLLSLTILLAGCSNGTAAGAAGSSSSGTIRRGNQTQRGFVLNNIFQDEELGTIHFNLSVPKSYDGSKPYALHVALPGWDGMYFQGVGADLQEAVPFESTKYIPDMIVLSVQYDSSDERTDARQVIHLVETLERQYNIDPARIYVTGYSMGGEVLSYLMELQPSMFRRALFVSSQWDGNPEPMVKTKVPLYMFIADHDSYYGSGPARRGYQRIHDAYAATGLSDQQIARLLQLDVRPDSWFNERNTTDYHAGGMLVAYDKNVMQWVFR